eukprot:1156732-Pelagomonas_calceolata.AAC.5
MKALAVSNAQWNVFDEQSLTGSVQRIVGLQFPNAPFSPHSLLLILMLLVLVLFFLLPWSPGARPATVPVQGPISINILAWGPLYLESLEQPHSRERSFKEC